MKIIRNGKEIELTEDELFAAYQEQEVLFDVQNIEQNMQNYLDEQEYDTLKNNQEFVNDAAAELRRNQDKFDMTYEYAMREAFSEIKGKYLYAEADMLMTDEMYIKLKKAIFDAGADAMEDFLGYELDFDSDEEMEEAMEDVLEQMSEDIAFDFYKKYCK